MKRLNDWFVLVVTTIFVFPFHAQGATGCDAALKNIGGAVELYQITTGKNPANLADLYKEGFVKSPSEFSCPGTNKTIASVDELDEKADFKLVQNRKDDPKAPLVMLAGKEGAPGRVYLPGGELGSHGPSESTIACHSRFDLGEVVSIRQGETACLQGKSLRIRFGGTVIGEPDFECLRNQGRNCAQGFRAAQFAISRG